MIDETLLWCRDLSSDKLWGVTNYKNRAITFWGKRGRELSFKLLTTSEQSKITKKADKKRREGYRDVSFDELEIETPGFKSEFDMMVTMAILGDNFKHTDSSTIAGI